MRTQYCRIKIVEGDAGEKCNVSTDTIDDLKKVLLFVEDHPDLEGLATRPIKALMKIPDPEEREKALSTVEKALKSKKNPNTGKFAKRVTESDVLKTIEKVAPSAVAPATVAPVPVVPAPVSVPVPIPAPVLTPAKFAAAPIISTDPDKQKRSEQHWYAEQFLDRVSSATKTMVVDIMRDNPTWKPADLLFYAITALSESKKKR